MITSQIINDFEKNIFHNTIIETFPPLPSLTVSVSNGNTGLLENKNDIEKRVIMTIDLFTAGTILDLSNCAHTITRLGLIDPAVLSNS